MHKPCLVCSGLLYCLFSRVASATRVCLRYNDIRFTGEIKLPADDQQPPLRLPVSGLVTSLSSTFFTTSLKTYIPELPGHP
jgi:hypothetical protein